MRVGFEVGDTIMKQAVNRYQRGRNGLICASVARSLAVRRARWQSRELTVAPHYRHIQC